jgi:hypothetical protein
MTALHDGSNWKSDPQSPTTWSATTPSNEKAVVALVRKLATGWNDGHIASMLNRAGLLTGKGNSWNETRVRNLRRKNAIPVFSKSQPRTCKTMLEAASLLNVSNCVIRTMVRNKILPAKPIAKSAPWMIEDTDPSPPLRQEERNTRRRPA